MYGGTKKKKMMYGGKKKMSAGGAKPDYIDIDGDGNKTESMKSAAKSKKKKFQTGGMADINIKDVRKAKRTRKRGERGMEKDDAKRGRIAKRAENKATRDSNKAARKVKAGERKLLAGQQALAQGKLKKAARKTRKVGKKIDSAKTALNMKRMGGFLEMPVFDLDRD